MIINFTKMNGAGNDFVVLDNRDLMYSLDQEEIAFLCDRHRGIGADGLLAVEPAENEVDFRFRYYNADGGEAEMCGLGDPDKLGHCNLVVAVHLCSFRG